METAGLPVIPVGYSVRILQGYTPFPRAAKSRITYLCSRSCERSEQFARVPTRRARFLYSKIRTRPGERINEAKRNVSREERVAEHRRRLARRGAEWLHGVMRSAGRWQKQLCVFVVND